MEQPPRRRERAREALRRIPLPALLVVALLLAVGPVGLALSRDEPRAQPGTTLEDVARSLPDSIDPAARARDAAASLG